MIGIAVTSVDDARLQKFLQEFKKYTEHEIYIFNDLKRKGVRHAKNECLKHLKGCDYVILLDDDCYPKKEGWVEFLIPFLDKWGHVCFNTPDIHGKKAVVDDILITHNGGGVMLAYTKKVLETVGLMNEKFTGYGWEHLAHSYKIYRSGLTINPYLSPIGIEHYLHAEDYINPVVKELTEEERKQRDANEIIFLEEASNLNPKNDYPL